MNTKWLMTASSIFLALMGIGVSFLPQEILIHYGFLPQPLNVLILQIAGTLYLSFAILNWTARANLIGGIYSRPVALANFLHFVVMTIALLKAVNHGLRATEFIALTLIYLIFAIGFSLVLFRHPKNAQG